MLVRLSVPTCLSRRPLLVSSGRQRARFAIDHGVEAAASKLESGGFHIPTAVATEQNEHVSKSCRITDEALDAALESFEAFCKQRDFRTKKLRKLSNPWPEPTRGSNGYHPRQSRPETTYPSSLRKNPMPHTTFRDSLRTQKDRNVISKLLVVQLSHCQWPKDILRVVAVAMQGLRTIEELTRIPWDIIKALYRCRRNVSDPEVLATASAIILRFRLADMALQPAMVFVTLKFAARSRSLPYMKKLLGIIRKDGIYLSSATFRQVIAKFSIGKRGLGEIRNGKWKRQDLLQVLKGFDDCRHLPQEQQYHLGSFLKRSDWRCLHGWLVVLARCRDGDSIWHEWELWRERSRKGSSQPMIRGARNDEVFMCALILSGNVQKAWQMFQKCGISFGALGAFTKDKLLEGVEHATVWDDETRAEMIEKYDRDLTRIEAALGVRWVPGHVDGEGLHELVEDQELVLDRLGEEDRTLNSEYGYPYEA